MFDRGIISLNYDDWYDLTRYQQIAITIITDEIIRFRNNKNTFLTY